MSMRTCSAIGRVKTPRAFVTRIPRSRAAGGSARSTPEVAEWTQVRRGARATRRSKASELSQPRRTTSTSSTGPSARPSTDRLTIRAPGAAARIRSRAPARIRADRIGLTRATAAGTPPGPLPGPGDAAGRPRSSLIGSPFRGRRRRAPARSTSRASRSPRPSGGWPARARFRRGRPGRGPGGGAADRSARLPEPLGEVAAQPGVALELEGMGRLVEGDPRPERPDRDVEGPGGGPDVLLDEEEPAVLGLGREEGEVVLAEDPGAHEPEEESDLAGRHPAIRDDHRRRGDATPGPADLVEEIAPDPAG